MSTGYDQHFKKVKQAKKKRFARPDVENELRKMFKFTATTRKGSSGTFSYVLIGLAAIGLGLGCIGYTNPQVMTDLFSHIQIGIFSSASAATTDSSTSAASTAAPAGSASASAPSGSTSSGGAANSAGNNNGAAANPAASSSTGDSSQCAGTNKYTDEEINHFNKLNEREHQLDLREAELNKLEAELHKQKNEIEARIAKLEQIRGDVANILKDRVATDEKKVNTLVDFYSNMKPQQAATIIGNLNEDLAVEVLGKMKKKNAAAIMNLLDPKKAEVLSEKFTGYNVGMK